MRTIIVAGMLAFAMVESVSFGQEDGKAKVKYLEQQILNIKTQMAQTESKRKLLEKQRVELEAQVQRLYDEQDKKHVSQDAFPEVIKRLQSQRVELMIDLAGMEARREVISEMKAEMEEESSDVLKQLEELLANEEEMLKRAESLRKTGVTSLGEMHKAKSRVLELKIRLAEARQPKSQNSMFREELLAASLDRAQKRAMLAKIEELLEKFTSSRKILEQTRNAQEKLAITMDELNHLEKRVRQLTVELDYSKALLDSEKQENKKR